MGIPYDINNKSSIRIYQISIDMTKNMNNRTHLSKTIGTIIMSTTGSCMKCGYQSRPRKNQSVGPDSPTCPKCNAELT